MNCPFFLPIPRPASCDKTAAHYVYVLLDVLSTLFISLNRRSGGKKEGILHFQIEQGGVGL